MAYRKPAISLDVEDKISFTNQTNTLLHSVTDHFFIIFFCILNCLILFMIQMYLSTGFLLLIIIGIYCFTHIGIALKRSSIGYEQFPQIH